MATWPRAWIAILVLLGGLRTPADGQVRVVRRGDDRFRGIHTIDVVIEPIDGLFSCGLLKDDLMRAATTALRDTGLRATVSERASSWFYTAEVDVVTDADKGRCATALSSDLIAHVDGIPDADRSPGTGEWGSLLVGKLSLLHELAVIHSEPSSHAARVIGELRKQISAIGERIRLANK